MRLGNTGRLWMPAAILCMTALQAGAGAQREMTTPPDIAKWQLVCYCSAPVTPNTIVLRDNNGQILYAARSGITAAQLKARGISASDSQLTLLQSWRLLRKDGDRYITAIPTLDAREESLLRNSLRKRVGQTASQIQGDVNAITASLRREHYGNHSYGVIFSYVLDGLMWQILTTRRALPSSQRNPAEANWSGAFWAVYPPHAKAPGTNSTQTSRGQWIVYTWNDEVLTALQGVDEKKITDVPHITNAPSDPIYRSATRIAEKVANLVQASERTASSRTLRITGDQTATLIVGHEVMWALMDWLVAHRVVDYPNVLTGNGTPTIDSLRDLFFTLSGM